MKKLLILLLIIPFLSCETNTEKMAGEWYRGAWKGKKFQLADDKYVDLAKKFMDAYENMNPSTMVEMTTDTVKFHPADVAGVFDVNMTNTDFIVARQAPMDSINRNYTFLLPIKLEETNTTIIETHFREDRYLKTGETESVLLFERLLFNQDDKISRVVQWMRPVD
tara:strand:- start:5251 stop:5748 length:498 start_codon:yes stop_codon:yes gene_type:complete